MEKYYQNIAPFVSCLDAFVNYVRKKGTLGMTASGYPKGVDTFAINELFDEHTKQLNVTVKTQYRNVGFVRYLFEGSFGMELLEKVQDAKGKEIIRPHKENLEKYEVLDSEEKYMSFLQGFWCEMTYNFRETHSDSLFGLLGFLSFMATKSEINSVYIQDISIIFVDGDFKQRWIDYDSFAELFANLGFWELERDYEFIPKDRYEKMRINKKITITDFGVEMAQILTKKMPMQLCNKDVNAAFGMYGMYEEEEEEEEGGNKNMEKYPHFNFDTRFPVLKEPFMSFFKPIFPHLSVIVEKSPAKKALKGNYYFKISLQYDKSIYRIIALHSSDTMEDLHIAIQQAFKFSNDHLYLFSMDLKGLGSNYTIHDSRGDGEDFADENQIENLAWKDNHKFMYVFDFGDMWEFLCELQKVEVSEKPLRKYKIVAKEGKAPKQY